MLFKFEWSQETNYYIPTASCFRREIRHRGAAISGAGARYSSCCTKYAKGL